MITNINERKTLTKYISYQCKCKFYDTNCKSNQWWNDNKCRCECKKQNIFEKKYAWNRSTCICENGKYLAGIMDDAVIISDKVIESNDEEIKTIPISFNEEK